MKGKNTEEKIRNEGNSEGKKVGEKTGLKKRRRPGWVQSTYLLFTIIML